MIVFYISLKIIEVRDYYLLNLVFSVLGKKFLQKYLT